MTGMFTGCGSSQQAAGSSGAEAGQTQTGDNSLFNEPGQLPIVNEPVTLTVFAPAKAEYNVRFGRSSGYYFNWCRQ